MLYPFKDKIPQLDPDCFVAPGAAIIGDVEIGAGSSIWFSATLRGDYGPIRIAARCSIQDSAVLHVKHLRDGTIFPTHVGDDCLIGHGAVVEGCRIGPSCLVGMNAVILPGAVIGAHSVIAAGAVVTGGMEVPPFSLVAGTPGKIRKTYPGPSPDLAFAAREYVDLARSYREAGIGIAQRYGR